MDVTNSPPRPAHIDIRVTILAMGKVDLTSIYVSTFTVALKYI